MRRLEATDTVCVDKCEDDINKKRPQLKSSAAQYPYLIDSGSLHNFSRNSGTIQSSLSFKLRG